MKCEDFMILAPYVIIQFSSVKSSKRFLKGRLYELAMEKRSRECVYAGGSVCFTHTPELIQPSWPFPVTSGLLYNWGIEEIRENPVSQMKFGRNKTRKS